MGNEGWYEGCGFLFTKTQAFLGQELTFTLVSILWQAESKNILHLSFHDNTIAV